jgi:hypothetical protein
LDGNDPDTLGKGDDTMRMPMVLMAAASLFGGLAIAIPAPSPGLAPARQLEPGAKSGPPFAAAELTERTLHRRAVEAAIWGMPIVSVDAMRQAFVRDAGAKYGDIGYFSKPADWKFQTTTPNASSLYVYFNFNTKDGPIVLDFPAAVEAGLFGTLLDAWQVPLVDVGPKGEDQGKGGKYLLLPPDFKGALPAGYIPVRSATYNGYALFRAIPATSSDEDLAKAIGLVKKQRLYPLAKAANPPDQRFIDLFGKNFEGIVDYDERFFDRLASMVNEEPVQIRDLVAMGQIRTLGIEKGKDFKPDAATKTILKTAVREAHAGFMQGTLDYDPWWPGTRWGLLKTLGAASKSGFTFQTADRLDVDARGTIYFMAFAPPRKLGEATFYIVASYDGQGKSLEGANSYKLHIPAKVPAKQFWAVTIYDSETAGFLRDSPRVGLDSFDQKMKQNGDGSVDVYFGPKAPAGKEANWVSTTPGKQWFAMFRFYGPEKALFEKWWKMTDIEKVK